MHVAFPHFWQQLLLFAVIIGIIIVIIAIIVFITADVVVLSYQLSILPGIYSN